MAKNHRQTSKAVPTPRAYCGADVSQLTYGRLDEALRSLGFSVLEVEPTNFEYRHPATGAVIFLPVLPAEEPVLPRHRVAVRTVLQGFGIPDPLDLAASIAEAR